MSDNYLTFLEKRFQNELEDIERRIKELNIEKMALHRQLSKARAERAGLQYSVRKNSMNRVLAENSVLKALQESDQAMRTGDLFDKARITHFDLKLPTFRTYLDRMKRKGLVKSARSTGFWELPSKAG